jgi:urocanate hydratase
VTTLDEALRILKNELRKGETVAVCVSRAPDEIEREMAERGVLPDLLPPGALDAEKYGPFLDEGARQIDPAMAKKGETVLTWSVADAPARWLPRLDALAGECVGCSKGPETWAALRWLRLSPRYLGRFARGERLLRCQTSAAECFVERVRRQIEDREISVPVEIWLSSCGDSKLHRLVPPAGLP